MPQNASSKRFFMDKYFLKKEIKKSLMYISIIVPIAFYWHGKEYNFSRHSTMYFIQIAIPGVVIAFLIRIGISLLVNFFRSK